MNEQEQSEPLSFKGQMAARYRERLSMGFTLANGNKGDADDSSTGPSVAAVVSDPAGTPVRQGVFRTTDQAMAASEPPASTSRQVVTAGLPMAVRSKSSLGEHQGRVCKPTMKDLITKFETRFFTSNQLRQNTETDGERHRIARDAWGSSCPRIKMELDPTAMTSSSSSDVVDSKSSATLSKPPCAKTSRGTVSLNHEANARLQMLQCLNRPLSRQNVRNTPEHVGVEDHLNVTNSHQFADNTPNQPEVDNTEEIPATKEDTSITPCVAGNAEPLSDKPNRTQQEPKQSSDEQESAAVRVNLRDYAQRRKNVTDNKYIVHTKDWGKRLPKKDATSASMDGPTYESISHNISSSMGNDKDTPLKDTKSRNILDAFKGGDNKIRQNISFPHLSNANPKFDMRCRSRQSERSDESKEAPRDENQRTKAMERYLQFLRSSNPPPPIPASNDVKTVEKSDLRKALRPPTPHRMNQLHKGGNSAFRNFAHSVRDTNQSVWGMQEAPGLPNKPDRDARLEHRPLRRPRSRILLVNEKKETVIDPSGGDFFVTPAFSSPNSVDSVCDYINKLNTNDRIGQPKSETSDIRLTRPALTIKPTSKWSALPGRNFVGKKLSKTTQIRPQSARAHDTDKKQIKQVTSFQRSRSSSAGKTLDSVTVKKPNSLFSSSPKSIASVASSNPKDSETRRSSPSGYKNNEREPKSLKYDASDVGSFILTEDELADNDLVPVHLRERKPRDLTGQLSLALSSSDDSQNARPVSKPAGSQNKKAPDATTEKRISNVSEIIDRMEPQCLDEDTRSASKAGLSGTDAMHTKSIPHESKRFDDNRFFILHGKRRSTNAPTKFLAAENPTDDCVRHKTTNMQHSKLFNAHLTSLANVNKTSDSPNTHTAKETRDIKEGPNLTSNVVPDERKAGHVTRDGQERKLYEQFRGTPEPSSAHARGDNLHATGESSVDKAFTYIMGRPVEPVRGSPSKKSTHQKITGHNFSFMREHEKDRKGDASAEPNLFMEPLPRARETPHRMLENAYNPFHFGHTQEKDEAYAEEENKTDKAPTASPQKKKRKSDQPKKPAKKKKKIDVTVDDSSVLIRSPLSPDSFGEKLSKSKAREASKKEEEATDKMERMEKSDVFEQPMRRKSSGELSVKSHVSSRKAASKENSPCSAPDKCSTRNISSPPSMTQYMRPVSRLTGDPTDRFPVKSHIPLLIPTSTASRSKLDRLIQYRRWREAMLDCLRPSKLPLSESFRKTLDSAVMEEWALHCWQPSKDMYVDSQGVWWSASYQEVQSGNVPESLLGDGRLFSKEGLLDLTARLPYLKVGPLRFLHATYVLMAVACVTLGHVGVRLYHCGGDDYEYYCQDDDLECLMQMFAQTR